MAYIGKKVEETDLTNRTVDTMVGDGSDTTLTLSATPISVNNVLVFINGIMQRPTTDYTISGTTLTFGTAPFTGGIVVAITGGGEHIGVPLAKIATDKISDGAVTNAKINSLSASKLTGALPALDGSALTGISAVNNITKSANDPTISSNPSSGLGTVWANTTSGETYVLTDATAGANVWYNVGSGSGDVYSFQGTLEGYVAGGQSNVPGPVTNTIQKFSFASNTTGTNLGDLTRTTYLADGTSSRTHGYSPGGLGVSTIDKFQFATSNSATSHGNLTAARHSSGASNNGTDGFVFGGQSFVSTIEKYAFTSNTTASSHGNLTEATNAKTGTSSEAHGFSSGGYSHLQSPTFRTTIDKFAFASNTTAASHGNLSTGRSNASGTSSTTDGYVASGPDGSVDQTSIEKHSFASNTTAAGHGDVSIGRDGSVGSSHTTHGYASGGQRNTGPGGSHINLIDKFAYTSNTTATDHGDLVQGSYAGSGHQY